jgi:hypothetical protein
MGAALASGLASGLTAAGLDPAVVSINSLIDPAPGASTPAIDGILRQALSGAMTSVFVIALIGAIGALIVTSLAPRGLAQAAQASAPAPVSSAE